MSWTSRSLHFAANLLTPLGQDCSPFPYLQDEGQDLFNPGGGQAPAGGVPDPV